MLSALGSLGGGGSSQSSASSATLGTSTGAVTFGNKNAGQGSGDGLKFSPLVLGAIGLTLLGGLFLFFRYGRKSH
jgi:hypothetical protein